MKSIFSVLVAVIAAGLLYGCSGKDPSNAPASAAAGGRSEATAPAETEPSFRSSTPKEAVTAFLEALRAGDEQTTAALLTAKAREETAAHDLVVEPPGAPTATYKVGRVEQAEGEGAAYVSCLWTEKQANGGQESFEVVWIMRKEKGGWRIGGMATRLDDSDEPLVLNFEDLSEMEEAMRKAEVAQRPQDQSDTEAESSVAR